jgi:predicted component of type VI protein secretion system
VRCRTIEEVFRNFKPGKEIEFLMEDGNPCKEPFEFKKVSDFKKEGIIAQSQLLKGLVQKKELLQQIIKLLKTNDRLRKTLTDKTTKENILLVLQALMQKLTEAE